LSFYYDFIDKYFDRQDYQLIQCDTDSLYIAFSDKNTDNLIKKELVNDYKLNVHNWLKRTSVPEAALYDHRKSGLFQVEYTDHSMVALNSKMYSAYNSDNNDSKFSCKKISKKQLSHPTEMYKEVLQTKQTKHGVNTGFRLHNSHILTYPETKLIHLLLYQEKGVSDGIHTTYLDIEPVVK
jgi:hypothetical protein